jgi:hypothetical protein
MTEKKMIPIYEPASVVPPTTLSRDVWLLATEMMCLTLRASALAIEGATSKDIKVLLDCIQITIGMKNDPERFSTLTRDGGPQPPENLAHRF